MNTKQVEELTGISRQNIRYYERAGLLNPEREEGNSYRDYSSQDVERLNLIKFLRMLDMPIEEISRVFHGEIAIEEAIEFQKEKLEVQRKRLQGAIEICNRICKNNGKRTEMEHFPVREYLSQIEYEQNKVGGFAQFKDDYKKIVLADRQRQFSYLVNYPIHTEQELINALQEMTDTDEREWRAQKHKGKVIVCQGDTLYKISKKMIRSKAGEEPFTLLIGTMLHPENAYDAQIPQKRKEILYTVHMIGRNVRRQKWKSILNISICIMVVLLVSIYYKNIENLEQQFQKLPESVPISAAISNERGTKNAGLLIKDEITQKLQQSKYVTDYCETVELMASMSDAEEAAYYRTLGINQKEALDDLEEEKIVWNDSYNMQQFLNCENICLADRAFLMNHNLGVGDSIDLQIHYYTKSNQIGMQYHMLQLVPLKTVRLTIAGTYDSTAISEDGSAPQMILSVSEVRKWCDEGEIEYNASSVSFRVKNAEQLNAFKEEMEQLGLVQVSASAEDIFLGKALSVEDWNYIQAACRIQRSKVLLESFYPLIMLTVLVAGMIVSYLLIQSRQIELAIMRMLGTGKQKAGIVILLEQIILALVGCMAGIVLLLVVHFQIRLAEWGMIGLFFMCYLIGGIISIGTIRSDRMTYKE